MTRGWSAGKLPRGTSGIRNAPPLFDALTATAHDLQKALADGKLRSTDLVQEYVWRTEEYNGYLRAVAQYAPNAYERAQELDEQRTSGQVATGPLHGIPVLLKNTISTDASLQMDTTAGAAALIGSIPSKNTPLVDQLLDAGAIILGKATSSELNWNKDCNLPCGWSTVDGQSQSPYVFGGLRNIADDGLGGHSNPGGSSTGVAVALAAGLAPIGVGCDTEGSITAPAIRASLYSMRPSTGLVSSQGVVPLAHSFDTPGPLAKDPEDLANLLDVLKTDSKVLTERNLPLTPKKLDWSSIKIGTLAPDRSPYPDFIVKPVEEATEQATRETLKAYSTLKSLVGIYHENVDLPDVDAFNVGDDHSLYTVMDAETQGDTDHYLQSLSKSKVRSLQELVDWNKDNPDSSLPSEYQGQSTLINCLETVPKEKVEMLRKHNLALGAKLEATLEKYGIDVIIGAGDSVFGMFAAANGSPISALPLSYLDFNGRAIGLVALAGRHKEAELLRFLDHYATLFVRKPPLAFEDHKVPGKGLQGQL
ncbi:hypothetical protein PV10_08137 [Exophiala mesophila]|uniref:Amidase domain-containing protein n=1 Tax=Exophiala mesophila TaxID=212818 RepID=A0A0D1Z3I8_EXOME|nr:uncharacterized protein PV10_08137 [Exophiala mesophila]KIV88454.1 hypothetical protein PV10_08137 [Exophiala mesophila]